MTQLTPWRGPPSNWVIGGIRGGDDDVHHGAWSVLFGCWSLLNDTSWMTDFSGGGPRVFTGWLGSGCSPNPPPWSSGETPGARVAAGDLCATSDAVPNVAPAMTTAEMTSRPSVRREIVMVCRDIRRAGS